MEDTVNEIPRKHKRALFIQDVSLEGVGAARSADISAGGMYIESVATFQEGANVTLEFKLNDTDEHPIKSHARVKYVHEGVGMGLAFTDISTEDQKRIDTLVHQM